MSYRKMLIMSLIFAVTLAARSRGDTNVTTTGGTTNYIPKFDGTASITNSAIYDFSGNVGIGMTTPTDAKLVLRDTTGPSDAGIRVMEIQTPSLDGTLGEGGRIDFTDGTYLLGSFRSIGEGPGQYGIAIGTWNSAFLEKMRITAAGNVGIGTTIPQALFHIHSSNPLMKFTNPNALSGFIVGNSGGATADFQLYNYENGSLQFGTNAVYRMIITNTGDVGIGTISPGAKLDVIGTSGGSNVFVVRTLPASQGGTDGQGGIVLKPNFGSGVASIQGTNNQLEAVANLAINPEGGNVGIGTASPGAKLTVKGGNLRIERADGSTCLELGDGLDYAEGFNISEKNSKIQPGTVLVIDVKNPGKLAVSNQAYDTKVAGIAAGANNLKSGVRLGVGGFDCDVALAGRVYCNVDATENAVETGDMLTTSDVVGYAMKATDRTHRQGAILGKAMQSMEKGKKGQILVLVTLQ